MILRPTFAAGPAANPWKNLAAMYAPMVCPLIEVQPLARTAMDTDAMVTTRRPYVSARDEVTRGPKARPKAEMPKDQLTWLYEASNCTSRSEKDGTGAVVR